MFTRRSMPMAVDGVWVRVNMAVTPSQANVSIHQPTEEVELLTNWIALVPFCPLAPAGIPKLKTAALAVPEFVTVGAAVEERATAVPAVTVALVPLVPLVPGIPWGPWGP